MWETGPARMDQCAFCGETRMGGMGGPHAVLPCPLRRREHEQRLEHAQVEHEARLAKINDGSEES